MKGAARTDELTRAWDEACVLQRPPMRRDAARAALLRVIKLADERKDSDVRCDAETALLVVESGGAAAARTRAVKRWRAFAKRRLRDDEPVRDLAEMMNAVGIDGADDAFRRAWVLEQLDTLAEQAPRDRKLRDAWRAGVVPKDASEAYRFARESLRRAAWTQAATCARVAEQHKNAATRAAARVILLVASARSGAPDVASLRDTIASSVAAVKRGRKVWMFDWRTLAALVIAHDLDGAHVVDPSLLRSLADAWRTADPTFAATALLPKAPLPLPNKRKRGAPSH